jgi:hypothetical protein
MGARIQDRRYMLLRNAPREGRCQGVGVEGRGEGEEAGRGRRWGGEAGRGWRRGGGGGGVIHGLLWSTRCQLVVGSGHIIMQACRQSKQIIIIHEILFAYNMVSSINRGHEFTALTMRVLLLDIMNSIIHYSNLHVHSLL